MACDSTAWTVTYHGADHDAEADYVMGVFSTRDKAAAAAERKAAEDNPGEPYWWEGDDLLAQGTSYWIELAEVVALS